MTESARILVVDDEPNVRTTLTGVLTDEGYTVETVESGEAAIEAISLRDYDLLLLDIWLPGIDGLEVLEAIRRSGCDAEVVMISGHGSVDAAVKSTKLGAFDFIEKPLSLDRVLLVAANATKQRRLMRENLRLRAEVSARVEIVGESPPIVALRRQIERAAPSNGRVLVFGENGTGKELVARRIHALSQRADRPFVEVNCAAIPEELIESELFGHVEGSFIDEVGDMSLKTQAKVLRVLEEQRFSPVGSNETREVDVRVIAATNKDLVHEIAEGEFRQDLYYRLNVIPFQVPPLRARIDDITLLTERFLHGFAQEYGEAPKHLTTEAMALLMSHGWPGNVRELRNLCERLAIMTPTARVGEEEVSAMLHGGMASDLSLDRNLSLRDAREMFERRLILAKLRELDGNVRAAADALDIERSNLYRKLKAYGIDPSEIVTVD